MTEKSDSKASGEETAKAETPEPRGDNNPAHKLKQAPGEIGGPKGPEPTRYGDWEKGGIVSDF